MCIPFIAGAALFNAATTASLIGSVVSAVGSYQQGQAQAKVAKNNADIQQMMADDAIRRGSVVEQQQRMKTAQLKGEQRAMMAGSGMSLESGTASGILQDTAQMGELDALTIRSNAQREAFGMQVNAMNERANSKMAKRAGIYGAGGTLLSSAGSVGRDWYMFKGGFTNPSLPQSVG